MSGDHQGLALLRAEMARQRPDALDTLEACRPTAARIAARIRSVGRLVLYGIGGSHHVNRIAETLYLEAGIDTQAIVASDALVLPPRAEPRVALITSQSGRSGEITALMQRPAGPEERFGITLERDGPLARAAALCLVASGGTEHAFAASRSIILSLAMHGAILEALGVRLDDVRGVLASLPVPAAVATATASEVQECGSLVFAGRHVMRGVAESAALSMMELARMTTLPFEGGQFRHGPFEFLRPGIGVILLRSAGAAAQGLDELALNAHTAGCATVILDASGAALLGSGLSVRLPAATGLAAAIQALLFLQEVNVAVACHRIAHGAGSPLRTAKVTL